MRPPAPTRAIDDPYFTLPEAIPFAPGSGPFRMKGWGYIGDLRFYEENVPGGIAAVLKHLSDPAIAAFVARKFDPDQWYDLTPKLYVSRAAARLRGMTYDAHCRDVSRWHAVDKFRGIYRPLLRVVSSEVLAVWIPRLTSSFYDFGTTESHVVSPKLVRVVRRGVPRIAVQWWAAAASAYFEYVLATAGAPHPQVKWLATEAEGERLGMDLYRMPLEISWA
jgi:hypothetical protein